jgi:hypothetical protein
MFDSARRRHAELVSASIPTLNTLAQDEQWTLKHVQGDGSMWGRKGL